MASCWWAVEPTGRSDPHLLAKGMVNRSCFPDRQANLLPHETTVSQDLGDIGSMRYRLRELTEQVARRLRRTGRCRRIDQGAILQLPHHHPIPHAAEAE